MYNTPLPEEIRMNHCKLLKTSALHYETILKLNVIYFVLYL